MNRFFALFAAFFSLSLAICPVVSATSSNQQNLSLVQQLKPAVPAPLGYTSVSQYGRQFIDLVVHYNNRAVRSGFVVQDIFFPNQSIANAIKTNGMQTYPMLITYQNHNPKLSNHKQYFLSTRDAIKQRYLASYGAQALAQNWVEHSTYFYQIDTVSQQSGGLLKFSGFKIYQNHYHHFEYIFSAEENRANARAVVDGWLGQF